MERFGRFVRHSRAGCRGAPYHAQSLKGQSRAAAISRRPHAGARFEVCQTISISDWVGSTPHLGVGTASPRPAERDSNRTPLGGLLLAQENSASCPNEPGPRWLRIAVVRTCSADGRRTRSQDGSPCKRSVVRLWI